MGKGIAFNLGKEESSRNAVFKIEHGSYAFVNEIIDEEFAKGYEPISIAHVASDIVVILFKKRGVKVE